MKIKLIETDEETYYQVQGKPTKSEKKELKGAGFCYDKADGWWCYPEDIDESILKKDDIDGAGKQPLHQFTEQWNDYLRQLSVMSTLQDEVDHQKEQIRKHVIEFGIHEKPDTEDSVLLIDGFKLRNIHCTKIVLNGMEACKWASKNGLAPRKKPRDTDLITWMPVVDKKCWNGLKENGEVPKAVVKKVESDKSYYSFRFWSTNDMVCSGCKGKLTKGDRFCKHCGSAQ